MDQLLFTEVCSEMAYLDFLGSGSLASLPPPCCLHSVLLSFKTSSKFSTTKTWVVTGLTLVTELRQDQLSQSSRLISDIVQRENSDLGFGNLV